MNRIPVTVVVATRNRADELLRTLRRLRDLPENPPVIVVDNASTDGTAAAVARHHPEAMIRVLDRNLGAAARNVGVHAAATPYVAFSDDDSWWALGALRLAAEHLSSRPRLALLNGRVLVGPEERLDEICMLMHDSPLPTEPGLPGPAILGFIACAAVVRRSAFLQVGGFEPRFGVGGEEELLAMDLARAGWDLAYAPDVVAHHHPSASRDPHARRARLVRNRLLSAWLRRSATTAWRRTVTTARDSAADPAARAGLAEALRMGRWAWSSRRRVPADLERRLRLLE